MKSLRRIVAEPFPGVPDLTMKRIIQIIRRHYTLTPKGKRGKK